MLVLRDSKIMFIDFVDVEILPNNLVCQTISTSTKSINI